VGWEFKDYEQIEHTGDICILVEGESREELYRKAGLAFFDLLGDWGDPGTGEERTIELEEEGEVDLFVEWLSELNFLHQTEGLVFCDLEVKFPEEGNLRAIVRGREIDPDRDEVSLEIKAVTYHLCEVNTEKKPYSARVIFDV
jgi:SHS2 domain-containing protein